jgi:hypothetical protein
MFLPPSMLFRTTTSHFNSTVRTVFMPTFTISATKLFIFNSDSQQRTDTNSKQNRLLITVMQANSITFLCKALFRIRKFMCIRIRILNLYIRFRILLIV